MRMIEKLMPVAYRLMLVAALTVVLGSNANVWAEGGDVAKLVALLSIPLIGLRFFRAWPLWKKIVLALIAGLIAGMIFGDAADAITPIGAFFLRLVSMLIVPMVFSTVIVGAASAGDVHRLGRLGRKTVLLYLLTTTLSLAIGISLAFLLQPGVGVELQPDAPAPFAETPSMVDAALRCIPENIIAAFAEGNILQILTAAILFGFSLSLAGFKAKPIEKFFEAFSEVMFKMTTLVLQAAPYAVFALIASAAGKYGLDVLLPLVKLIVVIYLAYLLHAAVVYGVLLNFWGRTSPTRFFKGMFEAVTVAFSSSSTSATLPITMHCAQEHLGVSRNVASFVLPFGANINLDGTTLYHGVCALFVAQVYGIDLTFEQYAAIILTALFASIGTAGVPGAGLMTLPLILQQARLPLEGIALVAGIDRILDMARSSINVMGDACISVVVAQSEGELIPPQASEHLAEIPPRP